MRLCKRARITPAVSVQVIVQRQVEMLDELVELTEGQPAENSPRTERRVRRAQDFLNGLPIEASRLRCGQSRSTKRSIPFRKPAENHVAQFGAQAQVERQRKSLAGKDATPAAVGVESAGRPPRWQEV